MKRNNEYSAGPGHVVKSLAGRDRNRIFLVTGTVQRNGYTAAVISDGRLRKISDGKTKNISHLKTIGMLKDFSEAKTLTDDEIAEICARFDPKETKLDSEPRADDVRHGSQGH